jgi:hypothetical protein
MAIDNFITCLKTFENKLNLNDLSNFKNMGILKEENKSIVIDFKKFAESTQKLKNNFIERFADFQKLRKNIDLLKDPINCSLDNFNDLIKKDLEKLRSEHIFGQISYGIDFWKNLPDEYSNLKSEILKLFSMFSTTYMCEQTFSVLKHIKSAYRNSLTDLNLESLLRISSSNIEIDYDLLLV